MSMNSINQSSPSAVMRGKAFAGASDVAEILKNDDNTENASRVKTRMSSILAETERVLEIAEYDLNLTRSTLEQSSARKPSINKDKSRQVYKQENGHLRTLEEQILELHISQSLNELPWSSHLNPCSNLLSNLCKRQHFNRLIVTLLPDNLGYSLHLALKERKDLVELIKLPYEDDHILAYINNQELPPMLLDLFDSLASNLYYSGCIITEIRDLRRHIQQTSNNLTSCVVSHVILRPTTQTLICDSNLLAQEGKYNSSDKVLVESELASRMSGPLCLAPNPVVSLVARKTELAKQTFNNIPLKRVAKKFSQVGINRKRKLDQCSSPSEIKLLDFISTTANKKKKLNPQEALAKHQTVIRNIVRTNATLDSNGTLIGQNAVAAPVIAPVKTDVLRLAREIPKRAEGNDLSPHIVEEYILETAERSSQRIYHTRLTIYQRLANDEYLGELYVERDFKENDNKGSTCRFVLGTRPHALRYINQFTEIFTEEGRKSVKITHRVPNQPPRVTYTQGMRERMNERERNAISSTTNAAQRTNGAVAAIGVTGPSSVVSVNGPGTPNMINAIAQQSTVLQKKRLSAPILQQQLSAPSNSSPGVGNAQLPQHPVPIKSGPVPVSVVNSNPPSSILQGQLTIQTSSNSSSVQLPCTPLPMKSSNQLAPHSSPSPQGPITPNSNPPQASPSMPMDSNNDQQEKAISAIMHSLMKDTAKFEPEKSNQLPSPGQQKLVAQLPTRPVPQSSLGIRQQASTASTNSKLVANRVSLQNILNAHVQQQPTQQSPTTPSPSPSPLATPTKVTMPQLTAQLSRPTIPLPPTYTQAVAQAQMQQNSGQVHAGVTPRPRLILSGTHQQPSIIRRQSSEKGSLSQDAPGLQALLANAPSADNPGANNSDNGASSSSTLLEKLVGGSNANKVNESSLSQRSLLTNADAAAGIPDSTQEITLATILAKPPIATPTVPPDTSNSRPNTPNNSLSPNKASPLLQQLQQPVNHRQVLPQSPVRQQVSPAHQTQPTKINNQITSPRNTFALPQSPHQATQSLMQPPRTNQSILSATLQQPIVTVASVMPNMQNATMVTVQDLVNVNHQNQGISSNSIPNGLSNNGQAVGTANTTSATPIQQQNVVSLQNLLQSGVVQVSGGTVQPTSNMVQLQIPGLSSPVTLSVNLPDGTQATSSQGVIVASQGQQISQQQPQQQQQPKVPIVSSVGKLVQTTSGFGQIQGQPTVVYQAAPSNFIQLPQQPTACNIKQVSAIPNAQQPNNIIKSVPGGQLLQVKPGQAGPVFLQMAQNASSSGSQQIQIVRSVPQQQPVAVRTVQQPSPQQFVQLSNALKSPPALIPTPSPQTPGVPQSPSGSMTSPQPSGNMMQTEPPSPLLIQLQNNTPDNQLKQATPPQIKMGPHRQQRKQSLK